jgi:uncharacterized Zn-binding protein involved in type VI secretion/DNA-binding XRE family transcriptional regulator
MTTPTNSDAAVTVTVTFTYALRIDARRDALGLSHEDLAHKAQLSPSTTKDILTGDFVPPLDAHIRLCRALQFTPKQVRDLNNLRAAERAKGRADRRAAKSASQPSPSRPRSQPTATPTPTPRASSSAAGPEEPGPSTSGSDLSDLSATRPDHGQNNGEDEAETIDHVPFEQTETRSATPDPESAARPSSTPAATDSAPVFEHQIIGNRTTNAAERHEIHGPPPPAATTHRQPPQWQLATRTRLLIVLGGLIVAGLVLLHVIPMPPAMHPMQAATITYRAAVPGLGCDHSGATWKNGTATRMVCLGNGGMVAGTTRGQTFAQELFQPPGGTLSLQRFRLDVAIALVRSMCGGVQYQMDVTTAYHYDVSVCQDGSVVVLLVDTAGDNMIRLSLPAARVAPASDYHLTVTIANGIQTVAINGQPIPLTTKTVAGACDFISLATSTNAGGVVHAAFANFALSSL